MDRSVNAIERGENPLICGHEQRTLKCTCQSNDGGGGAYLSDIPLVLLFMKIWYHWFVPLGEMFTLGLTWARAGSNGPKVKEET